MDLIGHRIERVGDQGGGCHHGDQLIQKIGAVLLQDLSVGGCLFLKEYQLMPPLAEGKKQGDQKRAEKKPRGQLHSDSDASADDP